MNCYKEHALPVQANDACARCGGPLCTEHQRGTLFAHLFMCLGGCTWKKQADKLKGMRTRLMMAITSVEEMTPEFDTSILHAHLQAAQTEVQRLLDARKEEAIPTVP
jgi:hypothetical protein